MYIFAWCSYEVMLCHLRLALVGIMLCLSFPWRLQLYQINVGTNHNGGYMLHCILVLRVQLIVTQVTLHISGYLNYLLIKGAYSLSSPCLALSLMTKTLTSLSYARLNRCEFCKKEVHDVTNVKLKRCFESRHLFGCPVVSCLLF